MAQCAYRVPWLLGLVRRKRGCRWRLHGDFSWGNCLLGRSRPSSRHCGYPYRRNTWGHRDEGRNQAANFKLTHYRLPWFSCLHPLPQVTNITNPPHLSGGLNGGSESFDAGISRTGRHQRQPPTDFFTGLVEQFDVRPISLREGRRTFSSSGGTTGRSTDPNYTGRSIPPVTHSRSRSRSDGSSFHHRD